MDVDDNLTARGRIGSGAHGREVDRTGSGRTAVVMGGSIAGLLAARVLSETFDRVLMVERDEVRGVSTPRRGVPHGAHVHGLLARGQQIIDELFPGFTEEAVAAGVPTGDLGELRWFFGGRKLVPYPTGLTCVSADRPFLEHLVRERTLALENVELLEAHETTALAFDEAGDVTGAYVTPRGRQAVRLVEADLVVDALGRGSPVPRWLADAGYERPPEDTVKIDLAYTSRHYVVTDESVLDGDLSINPVSSPEFPRGAFFSRVQGGRSIISLTGVLGDHAPTTEQGFNAWAASMEVPDVYEVIQVAEPVDEPVQFKFPASVRRRYERLTRLPRRLVVVGDAMCSFNPVYGQGMTVAALEALLLRDLAGRPGPELDVHEYFASASALLDGPWAVVTGGDLVFLGAELPEPARQQVEYMARIQEAASREGLVTRAFMRVAGLVDPPETLMEPEVATLVLAPVTAGGQK